MLTVLLVVYGVGGLLFISAVAWAAGRPVPQWEEQTTILKLSQAKPDGRASGTPWRKAA